MTSGHLKDEVPLVINIDSFLQQYNYRLDEGQRLRLVQHTTQMIERERQYSELFFFYHGVSDQIRRVYTLYTQLYQCLNANKQLSTLRPDYVLFHKLVTLQQFIEYFTKEDGLINNHDLD